MVNMREIPEFWVRREGGKDNGIRGRGGEGGK